MLRVAIDRKSFGGRTVLGDVGFAAEPGEVLALLAPSGTGKTTALRIVLGLDRDFTGCVERPAGRMAAVFQDPRLLPWMDVGANLRLVAPGLTEAAMDSLLDLVGLPGLAGAMPKALSLGMARRVALARALAARPSLLVLDEPFASLDPMLAARLARDVAGWTRAHRATTVLATHDLDQALGVVDRILVLSGSPATLAADLAASPEAAVSIRARFPFLAV
jgi:NitT/TauT family transport system ATP-binding protein